MALTDIDAVRLLIGDNQSSPFYPLLSDDQIDYFIELNNRNVRQAARQAAVSASMAIAWVPTREKTGDIEVWNDYAKQYQLALSYLINENPNTYLASGIMPYAAGISWSDILSNRSDPDVVTSPLTRINSPTPFSNICCNNEYPNTERSPAVITIIE
jgi:hypothetical protein